MHVILGMIILAAIALKAHRGEYSATEHTGVETGASYWHMVDLVWIILFPLIYIIKWIQTKPNQATQELPGYGYF